MGAACAKQAAPTGPPKSLPALKLAVLKAVGGRIDYCDPDLYPVARSDELEAAKARFPTIQADSAAYQAILEHEHLAAGQHFTDAQIIAIEPPRNEASWLDVVGWMKVLASRTIGGHVETTELSSSPA